MTPLSISLASSLPLFFLGFLSWMMSSLALKAASPAFASFVRAKFDCSVHSVRPSSEDFSLLVAFGRCRFRLDDSFVACSLSAILGSPADSFRVCLVEERIFLFIVSCKAVGLEIYKIREFVCDEFKLSFHLFNATGLAAARSLSNNVQVFPWQKVKSQNRTSFADVVRLPRSVLTGANAVPIKPMPSSSAPVHQSTQFRKSVFDRLVFPKASVFDRINWEDVQRNGSPVQYSVPDSAAPIHASSEVLPASDICLDLSLSSSGLGSIQPPSFKALNADLGPVFCRRCLSPSHARNACNSPIKCLSCKEWGHIAASCPQQWEHFQSLTKGRKLDDFTKSAFTHWDCTHWFKSARAMTMGLASLPRCTGSDDSRDGLPPTRTVEWDINISPTVGDAEELAGEENLNSLHTSTVPPGVRDNDPMACWRADPSTFIPHGMKLLEIPARKPMARVVVTRPQRNNDDLAIATIEPLPQGQITFNGIREVLLDFLQNERRVPVTDIQPTHLGQAYVRFRNAYHRDQLIQMGTIPFGNVNISFVEHNRGRNWRSFQFNRECCIMLLGFPPDMREDEYVVNTFSSFGRVLSWDKNPAHLSKLLVRARVSELEDVPQFLVISEGEDF